jgi:membrane fusion protein, heavy metal efflux system
MNTNFLALLGMTRLALFLASLGMTVLTAFLQSCSPESSQPPSKEIEPQQNMTITLTAAQEKNANIELDSVRSITLHEPLRVHGMLHVPPQYQLRITAPYGGVVKNTNILPGTNVRKGQVLTTLEDPEFVTMQEEYLTVSARLVYAEQELKRQEDLARDNVNARRTLQEATANAEVLRVRKRALSEQLAMIGINAGSLTSGTLSRTVTMRAPFNGYVTQVYVNNGAALEPNGKILELVDPSHLHVELLVFERDAAMVHVDQPITVRLSGESADRKGHVHLVGTEIGKDRTVYVHAHLNEADPGLRPGTTLTAIIETGGTNVEAVPVAAVAKHDGKSWVFTKNTNGTYTMHEVQVGREDLGMVEIKNGSELRGKQIVAAGANHLIGVLSNTGE